MVDRAVVTRGFLEASWAALLPTAPELRDRLLRHWAGPERHYHGVQHLAECLAALDLLGPTSRAEPLALWFHDAIHHNQPGTDEQASAELARSELRGLGLPTMLVERVEQLILTTIDHLPSPTDAAAARVCDADLAILGADPIRYRESVRQLRAEYYRLAEAEWAQLRRIQVHGLLGAERIYHTQIGRALWQSQAQINLRREHDQWGLLP